MSRPSIIIKIILGLLWTITHLAISFLNLWCHVICSLECYLISSGWLRKYKNLHLGRLKYLAIMVDSKEAKSTMKVQQLVCWLSSMGVKYVCLYDIDGILKKSFEPAMNDSRDGIVGEHFGIGANIKDLHCSQREMVIDCLSGSDGKEGIAKAANLLCSTYFNGHTNGDGKRKPTFTEADMASALKAVGCGGPEPDLLLMYGPARCHLGFPAWRLRYTEIMYMGSLKSMKYGAIVKALYNFSKKCQNYARLPIVGLLMLCKCAGNMDQLYLVREMIADMGLRNILSWRNDTLETTGRTDILCSLHSFSSAADCWSTVVQTLDITIDVCFVFACNKIKSVLSIEHTG